MQNSCLGDENDQSATTGTESKPPVDKTQFLTVEQRSDLANEGQGFCVDVEHINRPPTFTDVDWEQFKKKLHPRRR